MTVRLLSVRAMLMAEVEFELLVGCASTWWLSHTAVDVEGGGSCGGLVGYLQSASPLSTPAKPSISFFVPRQAQ